MSKRKGKWKVLSSEKIVDNMLKDRLKELGYEDDTIHAILQGATRVIQNIPEHPVRVDCYYMGAVVAQWEITLGSGSNAVFRYRSIL